MGANSGQDVVIRPTSLGHEMVQRLMSRSYPSRFHTRCHWFDTLTIARKQQARAIGAKRRGPIGVAKGHGDGFNVGGEPRLTAFRFGFETHNPPPRVRISTRTHRLTSRTRIL